MFTLKPKQNISQFGQLKTDDFNFEIIEKYFCESDKDDHYQIIDDKIVRDLDIETVFRYIDRTCSKIG